MTWKHEVEGRSHTKEHHSAFPPGHVHNPYVWRATLTTGHILVRGDQVLGKGPNILSPHEIPQGLLARLELIPASDKEKWPPMTLLLSEDEVLVYDSVSEKRMAHTEDPRDQPWLSFEGCVAVRLGNRWALPSGEIREHDGTYEEMMGAK